MDNNNWRPSVPKGEPGDWRNQLPQHLMSQQNSLHQQPLGTQRSLAGLQQPQQQLLSSQTNQQSVHMLSQPTVGLQPTHQAAHGLFLFQGQQSHHQHLGLQQQPNLLQQDVQQRLQSSGQVTGSLLPPQNVVDQHRQLYQSQRTLPEMPSSLVDSTAQMESANGVDWQEEVYQKIRTINEKYLAELHDIYHRASAKLEQQYSLPQQQRLKEFEKLKQFKIMLERMIRFLLISKSNIMPALKDNVDFYETQIISFLNRHRPRKPVQQGQLPQPQMQPVKQQSSQNVKNLMLMLCFVHMGNLAINTVDWRTLHPPASRQKNVNTLLETLKKHVPYSGEEGIEELMRIAVSFEELIFNTAKNQVTKLSLINRFMLTLKYSNYFLVSILKRRRKELSQYIYLYTLRGHIWQLMTHEEHLMDNNNWRLSIPNGESAAMNNGEWRKQLPPDSRQKIVNKIMETLSRHLPNSGPEGINDLRRIAARFEEKIFSCAVNQTDYLRKISMKMLTMETKSQNAAGSSSTTPDANNTTSMDSIPNNQGQLLPGTLPNNQSQAPQPLMSQTIQSNTASGITGSTGLPSSMPPVSSIANNSVVNQNSSMQNVAGLLQDSSGQHGLSSNMLSGSQRQMLGRPPHTMSSQQQQPQGAQYLYQQQQLLRQNFQAGNVPNPNSLLPTHIQQQQQQNVLQPNQMHSSQQPASTTSATQPSAVSSAPIQGLHTNQQSSPQLSSQQTTSQTILRQQQSSLLRQHPQSQQSSGIHQQQTSLPQQSISPQQQAQMMRQQAASGSGIQQKQMMGQHVLGDMQHQHQQRLLNQQNNVMNMQQQQKQHPPAQQQLMSQQNSLQATTQQPLGTQSNVAGLQQPQQQLLSSQVGNSSLQTNQQSLHMLSQPTAALQRTHQAGHGLYPSQGQQSQNQPAQQQMVPLQSHRQQLQQPNLLQQDVQQRLQSSGQVTGSLLPPQNVVDQQRQLYQSQRTLLEMPSSSLDSTAQTESGNAVDWQEEVFQKIKTMKDAYLPDITEIYQRVIAKLQQMDSLPQQQRSEQFEKLKQFKTMLERMMQFLSVSKSSIMPPLKNKVAIYEKQIIDFVTAHRPRKPVQQGQLPQSQMQPMQQQSSQNGNHSHDGQANPQMQSMSMPRAQQSSLENVQNNVLSSRPGASAPQQNIHSSVPASSLEPGQGNALNNGQQVAMRSIQQNTYQQVNNTSASAQSGLSTLQPNVNQTQLSSGLLQQQKDQQMTQPQQLKQQFQQRQMQQQLLQKQQLMQQHQEQLQARQQVAQNDVSPGMFQQHSLQSQRTTYPHQQLKPGSQLPVTSPQLLPGSSPQMTQQHSSPQIDQKNMMSSVNKMGTPVQPANSPFVVPSPATPVAPSPMQVDSEKPSGASSLSMGNTARQQATGVQGVVQSIAFGTPGISASPLLQEFTSPEGNNLNPLTSTFGKPSATELPIERLIRAVKSISPQSLSSAVSDIGSVVSMVDRIAGSAPGNGSRASVGEDFVAKTKCRLQARNFMAQEGMTPTKKMKRHATAMPLSVYSLGGSVGDNCKQFACSETSDLESTATSVGKKARTETEHALLEEIKEINQRLIDTVVEISDDEDAADSSEGATASKGCEGTTVRVSFIAVSLSPALKAHLSSTQMSPIQSLRLLVPCSYPNVSPSLLYKLRVETSKENGDLSSKAMARFNILLRSLSQPMSLKDIANTWDACARTVICEYAQQFGGGTFSSKYGTWEKFVAAF
uniref:Mediator complex subunit 15 KIX domain-containing protein n=1 Tax=Brassica oleracea TaxID=3712 RepID=A0A3P6EYG3_BRAOL|nr:unnamed protein product [Brassica oleracea]